MSTFSLEYALVDVFAEQPLEGNMLAIFTDARGLSTEQMQALARETNLAETTFILPASNPGQESTEGVRVRIFTTQEELHFAGHPTLGTASWLHFHHPVLRGSQSITLALNVGPISVRFQPQQPGIPGVFATMKQGDPTFGRVYQTTEIASLFNMQVEDFDPVHPIQTVSTGMPFCIVLMRSLSALQRLEIPQAAANAWLAKSDAKFFYCIAPAQTPGVHFHARMQFYNGEDPATGSAAGCAISWLVRHGLVASAQPILIEQGIEIRRPSLLHVQAKRNEDKIFDVFVGGRTIHVASGRFLLP